MPSLKFHTHGQCEALGEVVAGEIIGGGLQAKERMYRAGGLVWDPSSKPERVFQLSSGRVNIVTVDSRGNEVLIRTVRPGEIFGEICLCPYARLPHSTSAIAITKVKVFEARYQDFQRQLLSDAAFVRSVITLFCTRLAEADGRVHILAERDARARLRRLLTYVAECRGTPVVASSQEVSVTITHADLAKIGGLSRPHLSLLMTEFREQGFVSYERGSALRINLERIHAVG